jgi:hypothetical protein
MVKSHCHILRGTEGMNFSNLLPAYDYVSANRTINN